MVELYRNHINGKSGGYHFQPFTHNPRTIYTRHKGLYDGIPAHLAGLLSPMHLTLRHRPPVSHTGHSDSSAPSSDYSDFPASKACLVHLGFTTANTTNFSLESLLKAIPEYCQQMDKQLLRCLYSLFILPPK